MYLHLGKSTVVRHEDIIGIFDLDNSSQSHLTREYLTRAEKARQVMSVSDELPKSFVITDDGQQRVYLSQLGSATLLKRSEGFFIEER